MLEDFRTLKIKLDKKDGFISDSFLNVKTNETPDIEVQITDGGKVVNLTGASLSLYWKNLVSGATDSTEFIAVDAQTGKFKVTLPEAATTKEGVIRCAVHVKGSGYECETQNFDVFAQGSPIRPAAVYASDNFAAFLKALEKADGVEANVAKVIEKINQSYAAKEADIEKRFTAKQTQLEQSFTAKQTQLEQGFNTKLSQWEQVSAANDKAAKEKQSQLDQIIKNYQSASPLTKGAADGYYQAKGDYATNAAVQAEIKKLIGTAPSELDTLGEIATKLKETGNAASSLVVGLSTKAERAELANYVKTVDLNSRLTSYPTTQELSTKLAGYQVKGDYLTSASASSTYATKTNLSTEITNLKGGASTSYDTLKKIETMITAIKAQVDKTPYIIESVNTYDNGYPTGKRAYIKWSDGRLEQWGWWNIASSQISAGQAHGKLDLRYKIPFVQGDYPVVTLTCECLDNAAVVQPSLISVSNTMFTCTYTANKGISSNKTVCIYYHAVGFWK